MTREEFLDLKMTFGKQTMLWKKAFKEYNESRDTAREMFPLTLNCRSCYFKVLKWHEIRLS